MKFVLDENLSKALALALQAVFEGDHQIVHIRDRFGPATPDLEWMPALGNEGGWIVVSGDRRITKNKSEQIAFRQSRLIGFFLCRTVFAMPVRKQLIRLLTIWPEIEAQARLVQPGAMFEIPERSSLFRAL